MRLPLTKLQVIKNYIHIAQALILFLAWVLTIAVFTAQGSTDGRTGWYFGLCWLTIPILIYLAMVPAWSRARRFSNVYAFAVLDALSVILWLSAWAAVASYVASGKQDGTCDKFQPGSPTKCKLSEATIILGVIIMLLFVPTAYVSFKNVMEFKRTGLLPNQTPSGFGGAGPLGGSKPTGHMTAEDEAFDSNMNARNDWEVDDYEHEHGHDVHDSLQRDPRQGGGGYGYQPADVQDDDEYTASLAHSRNHSEVPGLHSYDDLSEVRPTIPGGPLGHQETEYRTGGY